MSLLIAVHVFFVVFLSITSHVEFFVWALTNSLFEMNLFELCFTQTVHLEGKSQSLIA